MSTIHIRLHLPLFWTHGFPIQLFLRVFQPSDWLLFSPYLFNSPAHFQVCYNTDLDSVLPELCQVSHKKEHIHQISVFGLACGGRGGALVWILLNQRDLVAQRLSTESVVMGVWRNHSTKTSCVLIPIKDSISRVPTTSLLIHDTSGVARIFWRPRRVIAMATPNRICELYKKKSHSLYSLFISTEGLLAQKILNVFVRLKYSFCCSFCRPLSLRHHSPPL